MKKLEQNEYVKEVSRRNKDKQNYNEYDVTIYYK